MYLHMGISTSALFFTLCFHHIHIDLKNNTSPTTTTDHFLHLFNMRFSILCLLAMAGMSVAKGNGGSCPNGPFKIGSKCDKYKCDDYWGNRGSGNVSITRCGDDDHMVSSIPIPSQISSHWDECSPAVDQMSKRLQKTRRQGKFCSRSTATATYAHMYLL